MGLTIVFAVVALLAVVWNIVTTIAIIRWLQTKGEKINFVFIRALAPVYAQRYKKITLEETGKVGDLFYHWLISINTALVFGILAIVFVNQ